MERGVTDPPVAPGVDRGERLQVAGGGGEALEDGSPVAEHPRLEGEGRMHDGLRGVAREQLHQQRRAGAAEGDDERGSQALDEPGEQGGATTVDRRQQPASGAADGARPAARIGPAG